MAILIDPPAWAAHGRLWSHLVSDVSYDELHAFAAAHGVPRRGFERDHYDVPADTYHGLVAAGASPVPSRDLLRRLTTAGLRRRKVDAMGRRATGNALLRPPRLRGGDLVAVTATAGPIEAQRLEAGLDRLRGWGLRVRVLPHTLDRHPSLTYLAGTDEERAADFTAAWMDDEVAAVIAGRGGYGTQRMLDLLDWRRLAEATPKIYAGFSDVTAMHQALASRLGVVTLHSHVTTSLGQASHESAELMRSMLFEPAAVDLFEGTDVRGAVPGSGTGVLVGGNLAILAADVGTASARLGRRGIVLLEDVTEDAYRIDRLLTQLLRAGWFEGVRGVVLGTFTDCGDEALCRAALLDRLTPLGVPLVTGYDAGHSTTARCVPFGVRATLDVPADGAPSLRLSAPPFT
jgi:muramoyltetrapeptide carboxypeptidase